MTVTEIKVAELLKWQFPYMPMNVVSQISGSLIERGWKNIGRDTILSLLVHNFAVAWVRHNKTDYERLLREASNIGLGRSVKIELRKQANKRANTILNQWSKEVKRKEIVQND